MFKIKRQASKLGRLMARSLKENPAYADNATKIERDQELKSFLEQIS